MNYKLLMTLKILFFNETSSFKDYFLKSSANQSSDSELHQQQILFLQKEITSKDNMEQCLLTQPSKQPILFKRNTMSYKRSTDREEQYTIETCLPV